MKKRVVIILLFVLLSNCGTLRFQKYDTVGAWFFGKPGYRGVYFGEEPSSSTRFKYFERAWERSNNDPFGFALMGFSLVAIAAFFHSYFYHTTRAVGIYDNPNNYDYMDCSEIIKEERHPFYLGVSIPELIFNPQGGTHFPETVEMEFSESQLKCVPTKTYIRDEKASIAFQVMDAGIIDAAIPYRVWNTNEWSKGEKIGFTIINPIIFLPANIIIKVYQLPFYLVHDVFRITLIPAAAIYYDLNREKK